MAEIKDGAGTGSKMKVGKDQKARVRSVQESLQHDVSFNENQAYQLFSTTTITGSGRYVGLFLKNESQTRELVLNYVRAQLITASNQEALPSETDYYYMGHKRTYQANGVTGSAVNVAFGSTNSSTTTIYVNNPTLEGTLEEAERLYLYDRSIQTFRKEGAVVVLPGQTMELGYVSSASTGSFYIRISFIMKTKEELS